MADLEIGELYRKYGYTIFRRCLTQLHNEAAAQDAVQETFARAVRTSRWFRAEANPRTWLCKIADNYCIDIIRRERRSPIRPSEELPECCSGDDQESLVDARRQVAALRPSDRRLAVLYYLDEYTQEEIAAELGVTRRTVYERLRSLGISVRTLVDKEAS